MDNNHINNLSVTIIYAKMPNMKEFFFRTTTCVNFNGKDKQSFFLRIRRNYSCLFTTYLPAWFGTSEAYTLYTHSVPDHFNWYSIFISFFIFLLLNHLFHETIQWWQSNISKLKIVNYILWMIWPMIDIRELFSIDRSSIFLYAFVEHFKSQLILLLLYNRIIIVGISTLVRS